MNNWATLEEQSRILNFALDNVASAEHGEELYETLRDTFGMSDEQITAAGFELQEWYAEREGK
jgi:hypothetical protein